jgi:hypothetical protein
MAPDPRSKTPAGPVKGRAGLVRELGRLDPWSFWSIPLGVEREGDFAVVGATGAYLIFVCEADGYLEASGRRAKVGGKPLGNLRAMRSAAKALSEKLSAASVGVAVEPMLCLVFASAGAPRTIKGVRVVQTADLATDISKRPRLLPLTRAQRAARVLGMEIAGDQKRHFVSGA